MLDLTMILMVIFVAVCFYHAGVYIERSRWNKLIERGILPKPKKFQEKQ